MKKLFIQKNILFSFCLIVFFSFVLFYGTFRGFKKADTDFPNYYVSSKMLLNGNLNKAYNTNEFNNEIKKENTNAQGLFVMYPPATALVMLPLLNYNLLDAKKIWVVFSTFLFLLIFYLTAHILNLNKRYSFFIVAGAGFNLVNDLMLGQVYIVTVFITLIALMAILKNKQFIPGILLGIIASIKLFPLLFIPVFLIKKKFKLAISVIVSFLLMNFLVFFLCDAEVFYSFFEAFKLNYLQKKVAGVLPTSSQYQSIEAFKNSVIASSSISDFTKNCLVFVSNVWSPLWFLILVFTLFLKRKSNCFIEIGISGILLFLLITEVGSASYHMLLLIPALILMFYNGLINHKTKIALLLIWFAIGFFPTVYLKVNFTNLFFDFNRLWLLVVFSLIYFYSLLFYKAEAKQA
jgi:hypothetical protein